MAVLGFSLIWVNSGALAKREEVEKHATDTSFYGYKWRCFCKKGPPTSAVSGPLMSRNQRGKCAQ